LARSVKSQLSSLLFTERHRFFFIRLAAELNAGGADIEIFIKETVAQDISKGGKVFRAMKTGTGAVMTPIVR
jgi:hypothetical protein